jgi:mRNA-degrading endonuclease toxin of MazEF toxin-antitoxin module
VGQQPWLALLCSVTSQVNGYRFEVPLAPGLGAEGVVLADQIERARGARLQGKASAEVLDEVVARVLTPVDPEES